MPEFDVIVVGAGVMGSATAWWLARWGVDVALVEQFPPGHHRGSSHGSTRIFRLAYPEPSYVNMAQRGLLLWHELEAEMGASLLQKTGGIDYGETGSVQMVAETLARAAVPHEIVGPDEAARNWPGFVFDGPVVHQPDAGRIAAERTVEAFQADARKRGAQLYFNEPVRVLGPQGHEAIVVTSDRDQYRAKVAVVTAGAWVGEILAGLVDLPELRVSREQVFHFPSRIDTNSWPSFIHHGSTFVYGLAAPGGEGVKVAEHHAGMITTADSRSFDIDAGGRHRVLEYVANRMPGLEPAPRSETTCLYTTTPDHSFVVERHGPIVVGSVCSGHGFKFAPLIGRQLASLACSAN